jgi:aminoglycoside phosphotransferase (APT) family kinase protein
MAKKKAGDEKNDLAFPLHEMLNLPRSTALQVETISSGTTALTLRVTPVDDPRKRYFVKTLQTGVGSGSHLKLGLREVRFYALIETLAPGTVPNIPKCIRRFISADERNYYLVLEDLAGSHQGHESVDFSRLENWKIPLSTLADFHKCFTCRLTAELIQAHADAPGDVENYIKKLEDAFHRFRADHHGLVAEPVLDLMARSIPLIRTFELEKAHRVHTNQLTTILHRDAHVKNFLYPRSADDHAVIVDWQFWGLGIGTFDLRHLLVSALKGHLRAVQEELVRYYYDQYRDGLDVNYAWSDCWLDYRKGIIDNLFMPVWQYTGFGWDIKHWGETLEAAVENYYALSCDRIVL